MSWNPFSLEQWVAWLMATAIAGISGTIGFLTFAESRFENKEKAELSSKFQDQRLNTIGVQIEKIDLKLDRLIERSK